MGLSRSTKVQWIWAHPRQQSQLGLLSNRDRGREQIFHLDDSTQYPGSLGPDL